METLGPREIDKLSAQVETVCYDWRRMRAVLQRIAGTTWWDLHGLCCLYCRAPFDVATGECEHHVDCVYERSCAIVNARPLPIPNEAILDEWQTASGLPEDPPGEPASRRRSRR